MTAGELLKLIPSHVFRDLAVETEVDKQVKKLPGEVIFKLILFSMLSSEKLSLRVMETFLQSAKFKSFSQYDILEGKYNSIRDRICTINAEYFERLFATIFSIYNKQLKEENALSKVDSTFVALATKLFSEGMKNGDDSNRFAKYTVSIKGSLPSMVKVFTDQSHVNENIALAEFINADSSLTDNIVVFDRGLQTRKAFDHFTSDGKWFITRSKPNVSCKETSINTIPCKPTSSTITIESDKTAKLVSGKQTKTKHLYRVIEGTIDASGEKIYLITNMLNEDPYLIATWYKQRWEIELFFKFIKQHLNFKHLVSRTEDGIKVMVHMTMILAVLILAYKKINKLKGFKIAKLKFELELENEIIKEIVKLCGGDPARAPALFSSA
jgi:hypothetical protein